MQTAAARLLDSLKEAVQDVFAEMLEHVASKVEPPCGDPGPEGSPGTPAAGDLDAIHVRARIGFEGHPSGRVVLRCCAPSAAELAMDLLTAPDGWAVNLEEVRAALSGCADRAADLFRARAFDGLGEFFTGTPEVDAGVDLTGSDAGGRLVYRLSQGSISVEIWFSEECIG